MIIREDRIECGIIKISHKHVMEISLITCLGLLSLQDRFETPLTELELLKSETPNISTKTHSKIKSYERLGITLCILGS